SSQRRQSARSASRSAVLSSNVSSLRFEDMRVDLQGAGVLADGSDHVVGEASVVAGVNLDGDLDLGAELACEVGDDLAGDLSEVSLVALRVEPGDCVEAAECIVGGLGRPRWLRICPTRRRVCATRLRRS